MKKFFIILLSLFLTTNVINAESVITDSEVETVEDQIEYNTTTLEEEELDESVLKDEEFQENFKQEDEISVKEKDVESEHEIEVVPYSSATFEETEWEYEIKGDTVVVKKYVGDDVDVVLPGEVEIAGTVYNVRLNPFFRIREISNLNSFSIREVNGKKVDIEPVSILRYSISSTFSESPTVKKLDLRGFDTSEVTDMRDAFSGNKQLVEVNTQGWDTSKTLEMTRMFSNTESLRELDLSHFNMTKVNSASNMFTRSGVEELDLSAWDTKSFWRVSSMFSHMPNLRTLDVSGWKMRDTEGFLFMFQGAKSLETIDLSSWDITGTQDLSYLLYDAPNLKYADLSGWDTSAVNNMMSAFGATPKLETLKVDGWDTSNVTVMQGLFEDSGIEDVDLSSWNTESLEYAASIFRNTPNLKTIGIENWDVKNLKVFVRAFENAKSIETLDLSNWNTESLGGIAGAFQGMDSLETLNIDGFKFKPNATIQNAFANTPNLKIIDLSKVDLSNVTNMIDTFIAENGDLELLVISNDQQIIDYDYEASNRIPIEVGITLDAKSGLFNDGSVTKSLSNKHNDYVLKERYLSEDEVNDFLAQTPTSVNGAFVGWLPNSNLIERPFDQTSGKVVLEASYQAPTTVYSVKIDIDGKIIELNVEEGSFIKESDLPNLNKEGYTFSGFMVKDSNPAVMFNIQKNAVYSDLELVAVYIKNAIDKPDPVKPTTPQTGMSHNFIFMSTIFFGASLLIVLLKKRKFIK